MSVKGWPRLPATSPAYEAGVSRPRLWAAKHWVRGARLQVATARETRTLEAIEQSCSPRGPDRGAPVPLSMRTVIAGFSARRGGARTRGRWRARLGLSAGPYLTCGRAVSRCSPARCHPRGDSTAAPRTGHLSLQDKLGGCRKQARQALLHPRRQARPQQHCPQHAERTPSRRHSQLRAATPPGRPSPPADPF